MLPERRVGSATRKIRRKNKDLGVLENQHVNSIVSLEEFEVQLDGFLAGKDLSQVVIDFLSVLWGALRT